MILSTRLGIRIVDVFFDESPPTGVYTDIIRYNHWSTCAAHQYCTRSSTLLLDLTNTPDTLISQFDRHTRNSIRRAEKENITYEVLSSPSEQDLSTCADYFDHCASGRHLPRVSRKRWAILRRQHALSLSFVRAPNGETLAARSYLLAPHRVRNLQSAAGFRATTDQARRTLIGHANRYLYWRDILRFQENGTELFDFGGWYVGHEDEQRLRINKFKAEFGGTVVHEYNCAVGLTVRGRVTLLALESRSKLIQLKSSLFASRG